MSITGKIISRDGALFVQHTMFHSDEPKVTYRSYRIEGTRGTGFARPEVGDSCTYSTGDNGEWRCTSPDGRSSGSALTDWQAPPAHKVTVSVPVPKARGKELRWHDGRWEKLMARGWVVAS